MEEHEYLEVQKKYWGCRKKPPCYVVVFKQKRKKWYLL